MTDSVWTIIETHGFFIFLLLLGIGFLISFIVKTVGDVITARAFEASRREVAAYVAEGSITPADAAALLAVNGEAEDSASDAAKEAAKKDPAKKLASMVAWGSIKKSDAARLVEARANVSESVWAEMVNLVSKGMPVAEAVRLATLRSEHAPEQAQPA